MLATGYILFETEKWKVNEWKKDILCKSKHEDWNAILGVHRIYFKTNALPWIKMNISLE